MEVEDEVRTTSSVEAWIQPELLYVALAHVVLAVGSSLLLLADAEPVLGVHPALKPLKFALSIAIFLGTMAIVLPMLQLSPTLRAVIAWTLSATMIVEMALIVMQALRGVPSHFNVGTPFDSVVWRAMGAAIVVALVACIVVAVVATGRTLLTRQGELDVFRATAWRAGLWLFLLAAVSGFAMGGRAQHSVGGSDGGSGLPVVNWSTEHGDLRVPHFVAVHALQVIPLAAVVLARLPVPVSVRWAGLGVITAGWALVCVQTLLRALGGAPMV